MTQPIRWHKAALTGGSLIALLVAGQAAAQDAGASVDPAQRSSTASPDPQAILSDPGQQPGETGEPAAPTEVVVRGVRGSLLRSIQAKRNADTIVDAISAEELGKFPNRNVAEALANIPGVTVGRDGRGEGRDITVRGLGSNFAITTLNGRILKFLM